MDRAINKSTEKEYEAIEIGMRAATQDPKDIKWIAPKDSIKNWDKLKELGINEVPVHWNPDKEYKNWKGTEIFCSPYFSLYPNSPAETVQESKEHKAIKNFIFNLIKKDELLLEISKFKLQGDEARKTKTLKIGEIVELIDWNNYDTEITSTGRRSLRADILLPFKKKHELLGYGIDFEVQLQKQGKKTTFNRSIAWALNGFSVVWIFGKDIDISEDCKDIQLKKDILKVYPYKRQLLYSGKEFVKDLKRTVIDQSQKLEEELEYIIDKSQEVIEDFTENINENKKQIKSEIIDIGKIVKNEIKILTSNIKKNIKTDVELRIEKKFFKDNKEEIENILEKYVREDIQEKVVQKLMGEINTSKIEDKIEQNINDNVKTNIEKYLTFKNIIQNMPDCPNCGAIMKIQPGKFGMFFSCPNYKFKGCKIINIPDKIKEMLE